MSIAKDLLLVFLFAFLSVKCIVLHVKISRQKEYFIKTLAHDFRVSTLAQINGLKYLEQYYNNELVCDIKNSCYYLLDMISMLQYIYRLENGEKLLHYEFFDLASVINLSYKNFSDTFREKEIDLVVNNFYNDYINADKDFVKKLFTNLISVILNYAKNKSKIIFETININNKIITKITYTGHPLSLEEYKRMFSINPTFSTVGHGIKMFFCKKIVDFHGGRIKFECKENNTNCFTIILPVHLNKKNNVSLVTKWIQACCSI